MEKYNANTNIYFYLVTVEFECGIYQGLAKTLAEAYDKRDDIWRYARKNFCKHKLLSSHLDIVCKRVVAKKFYNCKDLFFSYTGCCAFGN